MSFVFAKTVVDGREIELSLEDRHWKKPVLIFGPKKEAARFVEYVKLRNSILGEQEKSFVILELAAQELDEAFFSMLSRIVQSGARVFVVVSGTGGVRKNQLQALFSATGVKVILGASRYEMLWLPSMLSPGVRKIPLVTLGGGACVVDYGVKELDLFSVVQGELFASLLKPTDKKFVSLSAETLRSMLSVFDHELTP